MCGIAGCIVPSGERPPPDALDRMRRALGHRGPDDSGVAIAGNVGLVNQRLAIIDPGPAGHQPMSSSTGDWILTYNGEIFNHLTLREELPDPGYRGHSDTETLLYALACWGPAALGRINGFFSLASLDTANHRLLLARDRFGVKPLYVARLGREIWFASEIRALLAGGISARPQLNILAHTASHGWVHGRATPLESVQRVLPGTVLEVDTHTLETVERRWFEPSEWVREDLCGDLADLPREALSDRLEHALREAVRRRLLADVPVGTMCSGGLDSTLVTAFAREEDRSVVAFNASLPDERYADEGPWGKRAASALGTELDTVRITADDWRAALVATVRHHEYPLRSPSSVPIWLMSRRARERGVKVLLTGEAADELFGGYLPAPEHVGSQRPDVFRRVVRAALDARAYGLRHTAKSATERLRWRNAGTAGVSLERSEEDLAYVEDVFAKAARAYGHPREPHRDVRVALLAGLSRAPFPYLLNRMDKDAMAASIETRLPFLDPEVVALALNLPVEARTRPQLKGILHDVAARHLPPEIVRRPKQRGMVFDAHRRIVESARPDFLRRGMLQDLLGVEERSWHQLITTTGRTGLGLWTTEVWCRLFLNGDDVVQVEKDLWRDGI